MKNILFPSFFLFFSVFYFTNCQTKNKRKSVRKTPSPHSAAGSENAVMDFSDLDSERSALLSRQETSEYELESSSKKIVSMRGNESYKYPRLNPELEEKGTHENELIMNLLKTLTKKMRLDVTHTDIKTQREKLGHQNRMLRDAHPKSPGCLKARFEVLSHQELEGLDLPESFTKKGLLSPQYAGKSLEAVIRFSNATGAKPDYKADARGMAIKVLGIEGEKWRISRRRDELQSPINKYASESFYQSQDFVMIDNHTLPTPDIQSFIAFLGVATNSGFTGGLKTLATLGGRPLQSISAYKFLNKPPSHLLTLDYFSITPYAWFGIPMKFRVSSTLKKEAIPEGTKDSHILRTMIEQTLKKREVVFDFKIQHRPSEKGIKKIIEDASVLWSEEKYPFHTVAKIVIPKGQVVSDEKSLTDCDDLSFNVWNSLSSYQPLGGINRARRIIYNKISDYRHLINQRDREARSIRSEKNPRLSAKEFEEYKKIWVKRCEANKAAYDTYLQEAKTRSCIEAYAQLAQSFEQSSIDKMKKRENTHILPPKPQSKNLIIYDSCKGKWLDTGTLYREKPKFPPSKVDISKLKKISGEYKVPTTGSKAYFTYGDLYNVEKFLKPGRVGIPKSLKGIWWMHGNPVPEIIFSTSPGKFLPGSNVFKLYYADIEAYAWLPLNQSKFMVKLIHSLGKYMIVKFGNSNADQPTPGDTLDIHVANSIFSISSVYYLPTTYIMDGLWKRETGHILNKNPKNYHCYNLRRIVDEFGNKLPVYDYFVKQVKKQAKKAKVWHEDVLFYAKKRK